MNDDETKADTLPLIPIREETGLPPPPRSERRPVLAPTKREQNPNDSDIRSYYRNILYTFLL